MSNAASEQNTVDNFVLVNALAEGRHTQVWEVTEGAGGSRRVAMKLLLPEALKDPVQKQTLKTEHQIGKQFDHPNIIRYHEIKFGKTNGYFIMDMFRAPSLKAAIHSDHNSVQMRFKRITELIAMALEHVHGKNWIHKDIKPDNILVNKGSEVRLIDFSLSIRVQGALGKLLTRKPKLVQGTRSYMAPEQIMGKPLTPQTDMYSFGVTLFEMLTGGTPFKGSTPQDLLLRHVTEPAPPPSSINRNVTPEMDRIVLKLMEKKPASRFKNMQEFLIEFRRIEPFKEEVKPKTEEKVKTDAADLNLGERLNSRADAERSANAPAGAPSRISQGNTAGDATTIAVRSASGVTEMVKPAAKPQQKPQPKPQAAPPQPAASRPPAAAPPAAARPVQTAPPPAAARPAGAPPAGPPRTPTGAGAPQKRPVPAPPGEAARAPAAQRPPGAAPVKKVPAPAAQRPAQPAGQPVAQPARPAPAAARPAAVRPPAPRPAPPKSPPPKVEDVGGSSFSIEGMEGFDDLPEG